MFKYTIYFYVINVIYISIIDGCFLLYFECLLINQLHILVTLEELFI
jgi:hypothetical protein